MKKRGLLFGSFLLFTLMSGCDVIKDAADIEFIIERSHVYTVDANLTTFPYDIDLNTNSDYQKYKGKIGEWRASRLLCQYVRGQLRYRYKSGRDHQLCRR